MWKGEEESYFSIVVISVFVNLNLDFGMFTIEGRICRNYNKSPRCDWRKLFSRVTRGSIDKFASLSRDSVVRSCAYVRSESRRKAKENGMG